jgi:hypothetical protein
MKKLNLLRTVIDVFFIITIIATFGTLTWTISFLFNNNMHGTIKLNGEQFVPKTNCSKIIMVIALICELMYVYSFYLLRKVVLLFQERKIFDTEVIKLFNLIGILLIAPAIINKTSILILNFVEKDFNLKSGTQDSFFISIILGLFFIVISAIFKSAKELKEENDLTI